MLLDVILIIIFLFCVWRGWHKGLITTVFSIVKFALPLIIAIFFRTPLTNWAMTLPLADKVSIAVASRASELTNGATDLSLVSAATAGSVHAITYSIMQAISILAVFLLTSIICFIISRFLTVIANTLKLKPVNKIGGLVFGAIKGYLVVYVVALLALAAVGLFPSFGTVTLNSFLIKSLPNPLELIYRISSFQ